MTRPRVESPSVIVHGLGSIGRAVAGTLFDRGHDVIGGVDIDQTLAGRSLATVLDIEGLDRHRVFASSAELLKQTTPGIAVLCTSSKLRDVLPEVSVWVARGVDVVTTCEELARPDDSESSAIDELDAAARAAGCSVVAAGINPGFVMDVFPLVLTTACIDVKSVRVSRVVDASTRRASFQQKINVGVSEAEFEAAPPLGHVGLEASARLLADYLGWSITKLSAAIEPVVDADGRLLGLRQTATASVAGRERVRLEWEAWVGANPRDEIEVFGKQPLRLVIEGGLAGDYGTVGTVVNAVERVVAARDGFLLPPELPLVRRSGADRRKFTRVKSYGNSRREASTEERRP